MKKVPKPVFARSMFNASLFTLALATGCGKSTSAPPAEASYIEPAKEETKRRVEPEVTPVPKTTEPKSPETVQTEPAKQPDETPAVATKPFAFPDDKGGKLLAGLLSPKPPAIKSDKAEITQRERRLPEFLNSALVGQPDAADAPARLQLPPRREFQPTTLPEKIITDFAPNTPSLPPLPTPEIGSLHKQPMRDPSQPADLPILANKPVTDRAPLEDPTVEFTAQSVVSLLLPLREALAPFMKLTIPEPFEGAGQPALKQAPVEDPNKVLMPPTAPKP